MALNLKFWKKENGANSTPKVERKFRPKELPQAIGLHLIVRLKQDPDWVWTLRFAIQTRADDRHVVNFRIYDPLEVRNEDVKVVRYESLDEHPELILYEGWFDLSSEQYLCEKKTKNLKQGASDDQPYDQEQQGKSPVQPPDGPRACRL